MYLYSIILKLRPEKNCLLPFYTGYFSLAIFMKLLHLTNENKSDYLHEKNSLKPFTTSSLLGQFSRTKEGNLCSSKEDYFIRLTFFNRSLYANFIAFLLKEDKLKINIKDNNFNLVAIYLDDKSSVCPGSLNINDFWKKVSHKQKRCVLSFLSPTTFKKKRKNYVLPDSSLVFASLLKKLEYFYPDFVKKLNEINHDDFLSKIYVSSVENLNTKIVDFKRIKQIGFLGKIGYQIQSNKLDEIKLFNFLAETSFYLGVGAKTTCGFGQVKSIYEN